MEETLRRSVDDIFPKLHNANMQFFWEIEVFQNEIKSWEKIGSFKIHSGIKILQQKKAPYFYGALNHTMSKTKKKKL